MAGVERHEAARSPQTARASGGTFTKRPPLGAVVQFACVAMRRLRQRRGPAADRFVADDLYALAALAG